ncbi:MAG TPA: hypothetical protein VFJ47_02630 [Terriglobales bacterium]|nr:hypothetical protein [Terriglobales bacterium]
MMVKLNLALLAFLVLAAPMCAQGTGTVVPPQQTQGADDNAWSFAVAGYGYIIPEDQSYFSPTFRADRKWAHLEARYNYEDRKTGSLWLGYNVSIGEKLVLEATPMVGGVFGNTTGVAPGYLFTLSYKKISLYSEGEFVFDTKHSAGNFFYSWNELTYSPTDWLRGGLASQRTRAYQTPLDVQRGFFAGFSSRKVDFTTYVFNLGWTEPTIVLAIGFKFLI